MRPVSRCVPGCPAICRSWCARVSQQQRAIEHVEAQYQDQVWLWTLIPDVDGQWVLARGREASQEWMAEREAAKSERSVLAG